MEEMMEKFPFYLMRNCRKPLIFVLYFTILMNLSGCTVSKAPQFSGRWRPVNAFDASIQTIALANERTFFATPLDASLRGLLTRWARESGKRLNYQHGEDFTLPVGVAGVKEASLAQALDRLEKIYVDQGISIVLSESNNAIEVNNRSIAQSSSKKAASTSNVQRSYATPALSTAVSD